MPFDIGGFIYNGDRIENDARAGIVTDGLVLHLDAGIPESYPKSGTTWFDLSGDTDGTLTNGPTYNGVNGGVFVFDGVDDYVVGGTTLNINNSVTLEAFINPHSYPSGGGFIISNIGYYLELKNNGVLRSYFYGLSSQGYHDGTVTIPLNTWSRVAVVRNNSDNTIKHYVNGVLDNTISNITGTINNGVQNYQIGAYAGGGYSYSGKISNVGVYNRALTSTEITQNFNAQRARFGV